MDIEKEDEEDEETTYEFFKHSSGSSSGFNGTGGRGWRRLSSGILPEPIIANPYSQIGFFGNSHSQ